MKDDKDQPKGNIIAKVHVWGQWSRLLIDEDVLKEYRKCEDGEMVSDTGGKDVTDLEVKNVNDKAIRIQMTRV